MPFFEGLLRGFFGVIAAAIVIVAIVLLWGK